MEDNRKPDRDTLRQRLSPMSFFVTQEEGTEPPFANDHWDNHLPGIYVDVISGAALFCSLHKFDSGTGWPSFFAPLEPDNIVLCEDNRLSRPRVEVRSSSSQAHLGHLFEDGPQPTGQRYCINSAALRFVPLAELEAGGYGAYRSLLTPPQKQTARATLAAGCFWGVQELLRKLPGVINTTVGYSGGQTDDPDYDQICGGRSGHAEAVQVDYDPSQLSYQQLLEYFFRLHDPTTEDRQGHDVGDQYRSVIFCHDHEQQQVARQVLQQVERSGRWRSPVVTQIVPAVRFHAAEAYHQDYLQKHPDGYTCHYLRD